MSATIHVGKLQRHSVSSQSAGVGTLALTFSARSSIVPKSIPVDRFAYRAKQLPLSHAPTTAKWFILSLLVVSASEHIAAAGFQAAVWTRSCPSADTFGGFQLKSPERLNGRLDEHSAKFTLDDVHSIRSTHPVSVVLGDTASSDDPVAVDQERAGGSKSPTPAPPDENLHRKLETIAPTGVRKRNHWTGKVCLGINPWSVTSSTSASSVSVDLQRWPSKTSGPAYQLAEFISVGQGEDARTKTLHVDLITTRELQLVFSGDCITVPNANLNITIPIGPMPSQPDVARC